jgi:hypothetical protein
VGGSGAPDRDQSGVSSWRLQTLLFRLFRQKPGLIGKLAQGLQCVFGRLYQRPPVIYVAPINNRTCKSFQVELQNRYLIRTFLRVPRPLKVENAPAAIESPSNFERQTCSAASLLDINITRFRPRFNKGVLSIRIVLQEPRDFRLNLMRNGVDLI